MRSRQKKKNDKNRVQFSKKSHFDLSLSIFTQRKRSHFYNVMAALS